MDAGSRDLTRRQRIGGHILVFLQRHRWLMALLPRGPVGRLAWFVIDTPGFRADIRESEADMAAGRFYRLDRETHRLIPNPDWPKEGPQPREDSDGR